MRAFLKKRLRAKALRAGGYSTFALAAVVAIAVAVNLLAGALPETVTQLDFTQNALYSLSEQTQRIVKALDKDVTIYHIAASGSEDAAIQSLLGRYGALSSHIKVETVDPVVYPAFAQRYTSESIEANSAIVVCGERSKYVAYADIYQQVESENYDAYYDYVYYYCYTEYYDALYDWVFAGESAFTRALNYVTSEDLPKLYLFTGHGEAELSETLAKALADDGFTTESAHLMDYEAVPEDADAALLYAPETDISTDEAAMLISYLDGGGKLLLITDYIPNGEMTNLLSVCARMGMRAADGLVIDADASRYYRSPYNLLPILKSHDITSPIAQAGYYILYPIAQGIQSTGGTVAYAPLLATSEAAFGKTAGYGLNTYDKEEGDANGPFDVAACAQDANAQMVWFTSAQFVTDSVNQMVSGANVDLFMNALNWMVEQPDKISIREKSLKTTTLTVSSGDAQTVSALLIGGVPSLVALLGVCRIIRRKRR